eukprot:TRINITY_DN766_c0_g1_i1.p1 TRINITY_DN766_c0_g1~~TRINITY_DN766_c0_g1_i1.p1  ORF type:complete len:525 (-),score=105.98 TRINITY_DN766_c0_g1_i1:207-1757(-)
MAYGGDWNQDEMYDGPMYDGPMMFDEYGNPYDGPFDGEGMPYDGPFDGEGMPFDGPFDGEGMPFGGEGMPFDGEPFRPIEIPEIPYDQSVMSEAIQLVGEGNIGGIIELLHSFKLDLNWIDEESNLGLWHHAVKAGKREFIFFLLDEGIDFLKPLDNSPFNWKQYVLDNQDTHHELLDFVIKEKNGICDICGEHGTNLFMLECLHSSCFNCQEGWVNDAIDNSSLPVCRFCNVIMDYHDISKLIHEGLKDEFEEIVMVRYVKSKGDIVSCPQCDHTGYYDIEDGCATCTECDYCFCSCLKAYHPGFSCEEKECSICGEIEQLVIFDHCDHQFCIDCNRRWIGAHFNNYSFVIDCPDRWCKRELHVNEIYRILGDDEEMKMLFNEKTLERYLQIEVNFVRCPECGVGGLRNPAEKTATCWKCDTKFCGDCQRKVHEGWSCAEYLLLDGQDSDEALAYMWKTKYAKPCPKCRVDIEKYGGCSHVKCRSRYFEYIIILICKHVHMNSVGYGMFNSICLL